MASMALMGTSSFHGGQGIHLRPEVDRVAQLAFGDLAQPLVVLAQDEGQSAVLQAFAIAFENGVADVFTLRSGRCPASTARCALTARRTRSLA